MKIKEWCEYAERAKNCKVVVIEELAGKQRRFVLQNDLVCCATNEPIRTVAVLTTVRYDYVTYWMSWSLDFFQMNEKDIRRYQYSDFGWSSSFLIPVVNINIDYTKHKIIFAEMPEFGGGVLDSQSEKSCRVRDRTIYANRSIDVQTAMLESRSSVCHLLGDNTPLPDEYTLLEDTKKTDSAIWTRGIQ